MVEKDKHEKPETVERTVRHLLRVAQHRLLRTLNKTFSRRHPRRRRRRRCTLRVYPMGMIFPSGTISPAGILSQQHKAKSRDLNNTLFL